MSTFSFPIFPFGYFILPSEHNSSQQITAFIFSPIVQLLTLEIFFFCNPQALNLITLALRKPSQELTFPSWPWPMPILLFAGPVIHQVLPSLTLYPSFCLWVPLVPEFSFEKWRVILVLKAMVKKATFAEAISLWLGLYNLPVSIFLNILKVQNDWEDGSHSASLISWCSQKPSPQFEAPLPKAHSVSWWKRPMILWTFVGFCQ